ncbi:MAG: phage tail sheath subtilisin-like domain-containing protein [Gemmatimonadota bacterium]
MPQYLAPGVYVEEVPPSVQPIAGVGTSTAGFIGEVADNVAMPSEPVAYTVAGAGEPTLVTSWEQFKNSFGDVQAGNRVLAHAVYGFFNNGGTRCWVARVVDAEAANAVQGVLDQFAAIDEIALVAAPGITNPAIQTAVITHCVNTGDRFAILDGLQEPATLTAAAIQNGVGDSDYAAMYFPWITVYDPVENGPVVVPPSGHVAGIYARVDASRGVHKAPANEVVRGALGVDVRVSKADQGELNQAGINAIRDINGNITVWGARTLGGDGNGPWKYVHVRRLFLFLRESIDEGTQWVVFEPNTQALWSRITRNVTAFLTNVWRSGALFGGTPAEAFYVRCDASLNPPEVRELGQVITEIGVAVVQPAEFVVFRISQWSGPQG